MDTHQINLISNEDKITATKLYCETVSVDRKGVLNLQFSIVFQSTEFKKSDFSVIGLI